MFSSRFRGLEYFCHLKKIQLINGAYKKSSKGKESLSVIVSLKNYDEGLNNEYAYKDGAARINEHRSPPQSQPLPHTWNQDHQFTQADYTCTSMGTDKMTETSDFSTEFESKPYPQGASNHVEYNGERGYIDKQNHQFQVSGPFNFKSVQKVVAVIVLFFPLKF